MLNKKYRLPATLFQKIYLNGYKTRGEFGMLIGYKSNNQFPQFGFVVSKKIGNAVQRHKMTRLLREISREMIKKYNLSSLQFQYVAYKYTDDFNKLKDEFEKQIDNQIKKWLEN